MVRWLSGIFAEVKATEMDHYYLNHQLLTSFYFDLDFLVHVMVHPS